MPNPNAPSPDLERILAIVRAEAMRRGAQVTAMPGNEPMAVGVARRPALVGPRSHVRDFLALGSDDMLDAAYRELLHRPPDGAGVAGYRRALRTGYRTKAEVLGRIRYSAEGRRHAVAVPGLRGAFACSLLYRVPLAGPLAALMARALCLPPHLLDRRRIEQAAQEAAAEAGL